MSKTTVKLWGGLPIWIYLELSGKLPVVLSVKVVDDFDLGVGVDVGGEF